MYNALLDVPPSTWGDIQIKTDFRQVLKFFKLLKAKEFTQNEKALIVLKIFFDKIPRDQDGLWEFIEYYISCGKDKKDDKKDDDDEERLFDFVVDSGRILSAFLQTYGINLSETHIVDGEMQFKHQIHWWVFFELFQSLPEDTKFKQVVELRGKKPGKNDTPESKRELYEAQEAYAIESPEEKKPVSLKEFFKGW